MAERVRFTHDRFQQAILHGVTLVDFQAPWCSPCQKQKQVIELLKKRYLGKAAVREIDIDENPAIAMRLGIQSIPTIILFKDGGEMFRFIGLQANDTLDNAIRAALE